MQFLRSIAALLLVGLVACAEASDPVGLEEASLTVAGGGGGGGGGAYGKVNGGGHYAIDIGGGTLLDAQFAMSGHQTGEGEAATGNFHHRVELFGELISFHGTFTCLAIDAAEGRAWIGGIVTKNESVREPFASGEIYQPGRDIWFRVLDEGQPSQGTDRTTFTGFEGGAGIITSQEYCDTRPWPDENARTNPLTSGNLKVKP